MAARAGHVEVAKYLLQNKAKVNAKAKVSLGGGQGRVLGRKQFECDEKSILIRGLAAVLVAQRSLSFPCRFH